MKKRISLFFISLCCIVLALGIVPMVNAAEAAAAGTARIVYGNNYSYGQYDDYFKVYAPSGSVVTYKEGKKVVLAEPDGIYNGEDIYYFKLPNKGEKEITVKADGKSEETKLKVVIESSKKSTKTVSRLCKRAKYEPDAEGYEYGNITAEIEGVENGAFMAYVPSRLSRYSYSGPAPFVRSNKSDIGKEDDVARMNRFIKPLLREGATIIVEPNDGSWGYNPYSYSGSDKDVCYAVSSNTGTELNIAKTTDITKYTYKVSKVKIPKLKNPPKVKIDAVKGTVSLSDKMEYRFASSEAPKDFDEWKAGSRNMALKTVSEASIASGGTLQVRIKKTYISLYSKTTVITIPSTPAIVTGSITCDGVITNGSIKMSNFDKVRKPYEYTKETPGDSTKWILIRNGEIKVKGKSQLKDKDVIYIREKGVNENTRKGIKLKMPSSIAKVTVSGSALKDAVIENYIPASN